MQFRLINLMFLLLTAASAFAQNQTSSAEYNKREFFAGYSENVILDATRVENFDAEEIRGHRGWNASYTYNVRRFLGVKFDVSGNYKNFSLGNLEPVKINSSIYNFLGGVQLKDNKKNKRFSPFVQALAGISTSRLKVSSPFCGNLCRETNTGFALAVGGGVDLKVRKNFSIRLIQIDYNPAFYSGFTEQRLRAGFGIVIH